MKSVIILALVASVGLVESLLQNPTTCKYTTMGTEYMGTINTTTPDGLTCQMWDSQAPHSHTLNDPARFPDDTLADASNNCRNPDNAPGGPWCYTNDPNTRWQFCDVQSCDTLVVRCDDRANHIYINGILMGSTTSWDQYWVGKFPADYTVQLIAVECENTNGGGGLIAYMENGGAWDASTDARWKCSGNADPGWEELGFDDSGWQPAYEITANDGSGQWQDPNLPSTTKWVWADGSWTTAGTTYCRRTPVSTLTVRCDDHATIFVNGQSVGQTTSWSDVWTGEATEGDLIAIDCLNAGYSPGGLMVSLGHQGMDAGWKSSGTANPGWNAQTFDDSCWQSPNLIAANGELIYWPMDAKFPTDAKWMWKDSTTWETVGRSYFRLKA